MIYFRILIVFVFCLLSLLSVVAQPNYVLSSNLFPILKNQDTLPNSWTGGLNAATFSTLDVDNNGQDELLVLDRIHDRGLVFLIKDGEYIYSSSFSSQLPPLQKYALTYDYNKDGKKDLFTATALGIKAYKNISDNNGLRFEIVAEPILSYYAPNYSNMNITMQDIPSFSDVDNDGDMDILHFNSASGSSVVWERNMSIEKYGRPDSLDFKQTDDCWGGFLEQNCKSYYFGFNCKHSFRTEHVGAGSVLAIDSDNDGDKDLIIGKEDCFNLNFLENKGTISSAFFNKLNAAFPSAKPAEPISYPVSFLEDIDFDGMKDLIVTSGADQLINTDLSKNNWWYKNTGTNSTPIFSYQSDDFLQKTMIDLGQNTHPAFADKDGDGDLDLFISNSTNQTNIGASIFYFENIGDKTKASFILKDTNYLNLSNKMFSEIAVSFSDLNNDLKTDIIVVSEKNAAVSSTIYFNDGKDSLKFSNPIPFSIPLTEISSLQFFDFDNDDLKDAFAGTNDGSIFHYKNTGTIDSPVFSIVSNTFGSINKGTNASIGFADVDSDSKLDLIYANDTDSIWYYSDFKQQNNPFIGQQIAPNLPLGYKLSITLADLDNDLIPEIVIGNDNGGIQLLKHENIFNNILSDKISVADFNVYPNPSNGTFEIQTTHSGRLEIRDLLGTIVFESLIDKDKISQVELNLAKGIYFVSFGEQKIKKMVVDR